MPCSLNASSFSRSAEIFDLAALNSTILPNALCIPRHQLAAGTAGTKIIFAGGADQSGYLGNIDTYDSASGSWTCTGSLSVARSLLTAGYAGQVALFAGGSYVLLILELGRPFAPFARIRLLCFFATSIRNPYADQSIRSCRKIYTLASPGARAMPSKPQWISTTMRPASGRSLRR